VLHRGLPPKGVTRNTASVDASTNGLSDRPLRSNFEINCVVHIRLASPVPKARPFPSRRICWLQSGQ